MSSYLFPVTRVQRFCTHDGPGIRTTVFLKGCPLRCLWCHNPETQSPRPQYFYSDSLCIRCESCAQICRHGVHAFAGSGHILNRARCQSCMQCVSCCPSGALESCQRMMDADSILQEVLRDKAFYGKDGGVTLSGGEPMFHGENTAKLLAACKNNRLHTALETCGYFDEALLAALVPVTDLFLWDIKDTCPERHRQYTGVLPDRICRNLRLADSMGAKTVLRCIMVSGVNMDTAHYDGVARLYNALRNCRGVELLPYHTFGESKSGQLGQETNPHPEWIPDAESLQKARQALKKHVKLL